jgi:hypothetical protein
MKILIETIPHSEQRYPTCGDWTFLQPPFVAPGELGISIKVSELGDWRMEACVAIHEAVEVLMCKQNGVSQEAVDEFDMAYEKARKEGDESEPGDDAKAPYYKQHQIATGVERILAAELGLDWNTYENKIGSLF